MDRQHDFFREPALAADDDGTDDGTTQAPPAPLAVPCGFVDRSGKPCRRLAHETVRMNGRPFLHRGGELLHCVGRRRFGRGRTQHRLAARGRLYADRQGHLQRQ